MRGTATGCSTRMTATRSRLAIVPDDGWPLVPGPDDIRDAVSDVPGVEQVTVDEIPGFPDVFLVAVRGGEDRDVACAILRIIERSPLRTAGDTRVDVDGQVVWFERSKPNG